MSFIGIIRYYSRFVKSLADVAMPLTALLKKDVKFPQAWGEAQDKAVELIKMAFSKPGLVLARFDPSKPILLQTDASAVALGAVISHYEVDQNGKRTNERPICFSSKGMNKHQLNYSVTEKEGLAVVWATDLYRSMLVGRHFILETDHSALRQLLTTRDPAGRLCRWMLKLQELDMDIFHKKGRDHIPADFMTRDGADLNEPPPQTLTMSKIPEEFARLSLDDPILAFLDFYKTNNYFGDQIPHNHPHRSEIKQWVKKVAPHANKNPDGAWEMEKIVSTSPGIYSRTRIRLVPQGLTNEVISTCHNSGMAGHQSKSRTYEMLKEGYSWPLMRSQIFTFVDHCEVCQGYNMPRTSKEVGEYPDPGAPFRVVAFDFIGPLGDKKKTSSFKHILTVIDLFTRFVFLIPCKSTSSREVIAAFRDRIIPLTGVPLICQSDQEGSFSSAKFKAFCDDIGMCQKPCPQGSSNSNGCVERCNRSVQTYLKKMLGEKNWEKWPQYLGLVEFIMRNSRREDINLSPAEILFGFRCRGPYSNSL
ncbi:unnamed protein product, partial [Heterosigma akashiwo]